MLKQIKKKKPKDLLWKVEEDSFRLGNFDAVSRLKKEISELYDKEERMWHQRSWFQWLQSDDQNTKFFHGTATQRKRRNFIKGLRYGNGVWQEDEEVFLGMLTEFMLIYLLLPIHII